jgi:trans-aconitate methyltransferase
MNYLNEKKILNVLDCGCGNGRDSYTLSNKYNVVAVDNCGVLPINKKNVKFYNDDFVTMDKTGYDLIYSRFTFHSITNEQHIYFLDSISINSYLAIETRSKQSETDHVFYGKTHYRNYTDFKYLEMLLISNNFEIIYIKEDINFANYKDENPICIRVICRKLA